MSPLAQWLNRQPRGALTDLWRVSGVSWHTINRIKRGDKVGLEVAIKVSRATRDEVPIEALTRHQAPVEALRQVRARTRTGTRTRRARVA